MQVIVAINECLYRAGFACGQSVCIFLLKPELNINFADEPDNCFYFALSQTKFELVSLHRISQQRSFKAYYFYFFFLEIAMTFK